MKANVRFVFQFKSGKTFECFEGLSAEQFLKTIDTIKTSMREGVDGMLCFEDCCVRLAECSVVEWVVLDES